MKNETIIILDRSGSMVTIASATVSGFNEFIDTQRSDPGETRVTLVQFNDVPETVYQAVPAERAAKLKHPGPLQFYPADVTPVEGRSHPFVPSGYTALNDTIGRTLNEQGKRIHDEGWADSVTLAIVTDGMENASREFTTDRIRQMIGHAEAHGWKVLYLGANQDAFAVAQGIGIKASQTATYAASNHGTQSAWRGLSVTATALKADPNAAVNLDEQYQANLKATP